MGKSGSEKIVLLFALFMLALISGCIGIPDVFGRDVISVQQSIIENGMRDILVVKDIQTIPKSPLLPDQQLVLSFVLENKDTLKGARTTRVDLFNAPTMRTYDGNYPCNLYSSGPLPSSPISGFIDPSGGGVTTIGPLSTPTPQQQRYCTPDQCGLEGCEVLPGEEKPINFILRTPSEDDIKNIKTDTKLDFKVTYDFDGSLSYLIPAVSTDEIIKRQRSGDKTTLFTTKSHSSGPVQIDVELLGAPYMLSDVANRQLDTVILFKIKNRGAGNLVKSQIDAGAMEIAFPPEFIVTPNEKFTCSNNVCINDGGSLGRDAGIIPLYRDESRSSLRFTVRLINPLLEPFRTYQITANVRYSYELRNSVSLTINPFQNV